MKLYMFRTLSLSIIRSSFAVHSAMVYVIQVCRQHEYACYVFYVHVTVHRNRFLYNKTN